MSATLPLSGTEWAGLYWMRSGEITTILPHAFICQELSTQHFGIYFRGEVKEMLVGFLYDLYLDTLEERYKE